jgi:SAM-dependent methyltransferase
MPVYNDVPTIDYFPSPEMAVRPLYEDLGITSLLDVGAGRGGVFDMACWDWRRMERKEACDLTWLRDMPDDWHQMTGVDVQRLTQFYKPKSFDMVQCMEVLEHVPNTRKALEELCKVARKFVLISSGDEEHHRGHEQTAIEKVNPAQKYIGQPAISDLRELGFIVRVTSYNRRQIVAWRKF